MSNTISVGDYIIIQRQNFMKLHKLKSNGTVVLGKDKIELENVIGKLYYSTFRMISRPKNNRVYTLEEAKYKNSLQNVIVNQSGVDNRNISDDGHSQKLTADQISQLRDSAVSSSDIVEQLITNSTTFHEKTEYSQEKYLKKKEKKYFEYIQIRKPSVRLIAEIYYRQDPGKVLGLRLDDLSQILTYANVQADSKVLLYDSGTGGLVAGSVTNAIGRNTTGILVHMHPGNVCQKEALLALQLPTEQMDRCISVCLYSVLRCYYQQRQNKSSTMQSNTIDSDTGATPAKRPCLQTENNEVGTTPAKRPCWQIDNDRACEALSSQIDSLIIVAKEHPLTIVDALLPFLSDGKPFVVFSLIRDVLQHLYVDLKNRADVISLRLSHTLLRYYQVLDNRTHPDVNMTCGGYILTGFKISHS